MDVPPSSIKLENAAIKSEPLDTSSIKLEPGAIKNEPIDSMTPIKTEPGSVKADPGVKQEMDIKPTVSSNSRYSDVLLQISVMSNITTHFRSS